MKTNLILKNPTLLQYFLTSMRIEDPVKKDYAGYNFFIKKDPVYFRIANVTPKKVGQFVSLWKRSSEGVTIPFSEDDVFNIYIIATQNQENSGYFIFPKSVLVEWNILSKEQKGGKRGFRLYAPWDIPCNQQAIKTKKWQEGYFVYTSALTEDKGLSDLL